MCKKYDDEFKRNALRKVLDGQLVSSVAQELGINKSLIHKWKRAALMTGDGSRSGAEISEIETLKKRNRELEQKPAAWNYSSPFWQIKTLAESDRKSIRYSGSTQQN